MSVIELENGDLLVVKTEIDLPAPVVEGKTISAIISTENEDTDRDVIHAGRTKKGAGWLLDHFNKSPLILWQHERTTPNLSGTDTRAKVAKDAKLGRVLMIDPVTFDTEDDYAMYIGGKVARKIIKESSAGFIGKVVERRQGAEGSYAGREFFEQELIEASFANRGANAETDTMMKSMLQRHGLYRGVEGGDDAEVKELKEELGDLMRKISDMETVVKTMGDAITACEEGLAVVDSIDKASENRTMLVKTLHDSLLRVGTAHK